MERGFILALFIFLIYLIWLFRDLIEWFLRGLYDTFTFLYKFVEPESVFAKIIISLVSVLFGLFLLFLIFSPGILGFIIAMALIFLVFILWLFRKHKGYTFDSRALETPKATSPLMLSPGWDKYDEPLARGKIMYNLKDGQSNFKVTATLVRARPNTLYRIVLFTFSPERPPSLSGALTVKDITPPLYIHKVNRFGDTREGYTANGFTEMRVGEFTTDGNGDGSYNVNTHISPGKYRGQFAIKAPTVFGESSLFRTGRHYYDFVDLEFH